MPYGLPDDMKLSPWQQPNSNSGSGSGAAASASAWNTNGQTTGGQPVWDMKPPEPPPPPVWDMPPEPPPTWGYGGATVPPDTMNLPPPTPQQVDAWNQQGSPTTFNQDTGVSAPEFLPQDEALALLPPPPAPEPGPPEPPPPEPSLRDEANAMWADIYKQHQTGLEDQLAGLGAQKSMMGRRAAEMSAGMSGGVGGAFAAGQAQANIGAMDLERQARVQHATQGLELKMTQLQNLMQDARFREDQQFQEDLMRQQAALDMALETLTNPDLTKNMSDEEIAEFEYLLQTGDYQAAQEMASAAAANEVGQPHPVW